MREIEHAGNAEYQRKSHRTKRVKRTNCETIDQYLPKHHRLDPPPAIATPQHPPCLSSMLPASRRRAGSKRASIAAHSSVGGSNLDEARELQLAIGEFGRPQVDLVSILPLQHGPGDSLGSDLQRVRIGRILAFELHAAD